MSLKCTAVPPPLCLVTFRCNATIHDILNLSGYPVFLQQLYVFKTMGCGCSTTEYN